MLAVPPRGYGGLETVVATLTTELRRRGHRVVLATVGESEQDADGGVWAFPRGRFARLAAPYPEVVGAAHAHAQVVVAEDEDHREAVSRRTCPTSSIRPGTCPAVGCGYPARS